MKLYFSIWGYCDPTRVGYDFVGVPYHSEKPFVFAGVGESQVYEVEIPDTYTQEEADGIGKKAVKLIEESGNYNPRWAVRTVLEGDA